MNFTTALDRLRLLSEAHGAPGNEDEVRRIVSQQLAAYPQEIDRSGNLVVSVEGSNSGPSIMVTAHLDEVGFVVQHICRDGFLKLQPLGSWWPPVILGHRLRIKGTTGQEVIGVVASTPPHFMKEHERENLIAIEELFVDIGASSRAEVEGKFGIELGSPIVPDAPFQAMEGTTLLMGKAFDNRVGVSILVESLLALSHKNHPSMVVGASTVQEEVGARGARTVCATAKPDIAIVLEVAPADDGPGSRRDESQSALGAGTQLRVLDPGAIMHRKLFALVREVAAREKLPLQIAVRRSGGTDAREIQWQNGGIPTIVLGVPGRYIHSHNSIVDRRDVESTTMLVSALLQRLSRNEVMELTSFA